MYESVTSIDLGHFCTTEATGEENKKKNMAEPIENMKCLEKFQLMGLTSVNQQSGYD